MYALHGWEPSKDMFHTMNDHIGLELEFMAVLCEEELLACQTDNAAVSYTHLSLGKEKSALLLNIFLNIFDGILVTSFAMITHLNKKVNTLKCKSKTIDQKERLS